jgi:hypothetical protein
MKLDTKAFALAGGVIWGLAMAICTIISLANGYASQFMGLMADIYPGYTVTVAGIFVGAIYGFLDAFIGGWIFAALYNKFLK